MDFSKFGKAVNERYTKLAANNLFVVGVERDELFDLYLKSFPLGSNPIYKTKTEHDCSCCKNFIRNNGHVVAVVDGNIQTIWDITVDEPAYQAVADALAAHVRSKAIVGVFRALQSQQGAEVTYEHWAGGISWNHFHFNLPKQFVLNKGQSIGEFNNEMNTNKELLQRGVTEITLEACEVVADLINQNSIYRGEEHKATVKRAVQVIREFKSVPADQMNTWLWAKSIELGATGRFKNSVIGTLLIDLSSGVDVEDAVKMFESKVAPSNYKRPKALITQGMIDKARKDIEELGLEAALYRRYANTEDLTINNVIYADRSSKKVMMGSAFDVLESKVKVNTPNLDKVQEITIEKFLSDVVPTATSIEVMLDNKHVSNLVSLVAPVDKDAGSILKWDNNFTWSYNGEVADSMKERVKAFGGKVDGELRFSIQWNDAGEPNENDLDAHAIEPKGGHIYFCNTREMSSGTLDVDIRVPNGKVAVENIIYTDRSKMPEGKYQFKVHNFSQRGDSKGFSAEIEFDGIIFPFHYEKRMSSGGYVTVAEVEYTKKGGFKMLSSLTGSTQSKSVWGVNTNIWSKVNLILNSPNHWDGQQTGNKHYFFMLDGCKNPDNVRGFYNEFLKDELTQHRKVFEVLGSQLKAPYSDNQLSGVGFSSTVQNSVLVKVGGSFNRIVKVTF